MDRTKARHVKEKLRDVAVGILTPFDGHDKEILHTDIRENVNSLYDAGIRTFLACANISEYHSLSHEERVAVTKTSVSAVGDDACVLAGVGGSIPAAVDLASEHIQTGADAIMVMPPDHTYKHEKGLLQYYEKISASTDLPVVPYIRGYNPTIDFLVQLTEIDGVVGIKYALDDIVKFREAMQKGNHDVVWVAVTETLAPEFYMEGAEGFTAGASNFRPEIGLKLMEALEDGDYERATQLRDITTKYQQFRQETGSCNTFNAAVSIPAIKYGLELAGFNGGAVRPPLVELSDSDKARAHEMYKTIENTNIDALSS